MSNSSSLPADPPSLVEEIPLIQRDLSWLSFNHRVLQEAADPQLPLFERVKFLAIYSSNLDEFFRVRVALIRQMLRMKKKARKKLGGPPGKVLTQILQTVHEQQEEFGKIYRDVILPEMKSHGVELLQENELSTTQKDFVLDWFEKEIKPTLDFQTVIRAGGTPFLKDGGLYLSVLFKGFKVGEEWEGSQPYGLIQIPSETARFLELPATEGTHAVIFIDDVIRMGAKGLFGEYEPEAFYALKLNRDADLNIEDEFSGNLVEKIRKALSKRDRGIPSRFLYDGATPPPFLKMLRKQFGLSKKDLVKGGRYHNFSDFFGFPFPDIPSLSFPALPPLPVTEMEEKKDLFELVKQQDRFLSFPYQKYDYVIDFLEAAAEDPFVKEIAITLYRVAKGSRVGTALVKAAQHGKKVTAFLEVKARFDEASNLFWRNELAEAGVNILPEIPGIKVHAKIFVVRRAEPEGEKSYAYLGTGNFNEKTARIYCDHGLLTCDEEMTKELWQVFDGLEQGAMGTHFEQLLVSPTTLRNGFLAKVDREIQHAKAGNTASMLLKMNSLEDPFMIEKLYEASQAGVQIHLIVRGICRLIPSKASWSENIKITSIVDRFLEHTRAFHFHNNGEEELYLASADWMTRNLDRRVEIGFPIKNPESIKTLSAILDLQVGDNVKARILNEALDNPFVKKDQQIIQAQIATYELLSKLI